MDVVCTSRTPEFFLITLMSSTGRILNETTRQHQPGEPVADFTISLPQSVDVCSLHVRIRAGNSAGMSAPSEPVEVGKLQFCYNLLFNNLDAFSAVCSGVRTSLSIATSAISTEIDAITRIDDHKQGDHTKLIGTILIFLQ